MKSSKNISQNVKVNPSIKTNTNDPFIQKKLDLAINVLKKLKVPVN